MTIVMSEIVNHTFYNNKIPYNMLLKFQFSNLDLLCYTNATQNEDISEEWFVYQKYTTCNLENIVCT